MLNSSLSFGLQSAVMEDDLSLVLGVLASAAGLVLQPAAAGARLVASRRRWPRDGRRRPGQGPTLPAQGNALGGCGFSRRSATAAKNARIRFALAPRSPLPTRLF